MIIKEEFIKKLAEDITPHIYPHFTPLTSVVYAIAEAAFDLIKDDLAANSLIHPEVMIKGGVRYDLLNHLLFGPNDEPIYITATESRLLDYLGLHANQVMTFHQILGNVWGPEYTDSLSYLRVWISRLRKAGIPNDSLENVPGRGYRLLVEPPK